MFKQLYTGSRSHYVDAVRCQGWFVVSGNYCLPVPNRKSTVPSPYTTGAKNVLRKERKSSSKVQILPSFSQHTLTQPIIQIEFHLEHHPNWVICWWDYCVETPRTACLSTVSFAILFYIGHKLQALQVCSSNSVLTYCYIFNCVFFVFECFVEFFGLGSDMPAAASSNTAAPYQPMPSNPISPMRNIHTDTLG